ncbi:MAG: hypothetical protein HY318_10085 [Armatimonadetes bacterium]|nr:hypothetical protein [Armatimonadota bacterium]
MTARERVQCVVNREYPDRIPKEAGFTPAIHETFKERTGHDSPPEYFGFETRHVGFRGPEQLPDFSRYFPELPERAYVGSEYGTAFKPGSLYHFNRYLFPLGEARDVSDLEGYPFPDFMPEYRHTHLEAEVQRLHEQGYFTDGFCGHIFETTWQILGFEQTFEHFVNCPELVGAVLDKVTEDNCFKARRLAEAGVDMLRTGDDVGMQDRLMMHPEVWRKWLKPCLAREIAAAREVNANLPVWYHIDGNIIDIVDDLIEVGVTVLNPVQPECLDVKSLKEAYGDRIAFWGTIGTQTVMPFGSPAEVRQAVKSMIDLFAPGLFLAPTHVLEPDVPWDNIVAFFEAVEEFGEMDQ